MQPLGKSPGESHPEHRQEMNGSELLQHAKTVLAEIQRLHREYHSEAPGKLSDGENEEAFRQAMLVMDRLSQDPQQDMDEVRALVEALKTCMDMWPHKHSSVGEWYPHLNDILANASRTRLSSVLGTPAYYTAV